MPEYLPITTAFSKRNSNFYPNIDIAYWLIGNLKAFISWNNAMRMPTFTDMYYTSPNHEGNPVLQPEKSESFELGIKYAKPWIAASLNGFYTKLTT